MSFSIFRLELAAELSSANLVGLAFGMPDTARHHSDGTQTTLALQRDEQAGCEYRTQRQKPGKQNVRRHG